MLDHEAAGGVRERAGGRAAGHLTPVRRIAAFVGSLLAVAAAGALFVIAWAAAALQCDESCTRDGHWWTDPAAYQWSVQFGLACVVLFATITALVSVAKRRKQVTAWSGVVALVLAVIWAKLVLLDASFLG